MQKNFSKMYYSECNIYKTNFPRELVISIFLLLQSSLRKQKVLILFDIKVLFI